uniref:Uncharacterized protein n=1 Tax=Anguilla anguilla TaxID=7936 RepID=A0A0E9QS69_ANGAN
MHLLMCSRHTVHIAFQVCILSKTMAVFSNNKPWLSKDGKPYTNCRMKASRVVSHLKLPNMSFRWP